jgi:polar amino acid transport system substrate-binding protein
MKKRFSVFQLGWVVLLMFGLSSLAFAGEIQQKLTAESTIEQALKRGTFRVGMSTFVPWAMKDKTGNLVGFEIDVATRLAKDLGLKVEFVPTQWAGIIPALLTGKFDALVGGMGITAERSLKVNFTIPYDMTGMSICAHKKLAAGFKSVEDFNRPDVTVAVRMGATPVAAVKKFMPKAKMRQFDDEAQAYQELLNGNVHAVVGSAPTPAFQALKYPDTLFVPIQGTFTKEPIAMAVRKGDPDTLNVFNSWITIVDSEGWLQDRNHYWFETQDWKSMVE